MYKTDCRYFLGVKPCRFGRLCPACRDYQPIGKRILIIKLASIGDVLRTTPLLRALRSKHPRAHILWLTEKESLPALRGNNFIDEVLTMGFSSFARLQVESFDMVLSLDKAPEAASIAALIKARVKKGYGLNSSGKIFPFNKDADYGFLLGLSDELKFRRNRKTYQQIIFETCGFEFNNEEYMLCLGERQREFKEKFIKASRLTAGKYIIGLNTGCGSAFPHKKWGEDKFAGLAGELSKIKGIRLLLLGGREEKKANSSILRKVKRGIIDSGNNNTLEDFMAIIDCCDLVVSADTMAMHAAIALKKKVVAVFGPTCPQEVYLYGRGIKLVSSAQCAPCYKQYCRKNGSCMEDISVENALAAVKKAIAL